MVTLASVHMLNTFASKANLAIEADHSDADAPHSGEVLFSLRYDQSLRYAVKLLLGLPPHSGGGFRSSRGLVVIVRRSGPDLGTRTATSAFVEQRDDSLKGARLSNTVELLPRAI